jgi:hypothetical protein
MVVVMSVKNSLKERIKRRLGYPVVKVELDDQQILDCIDYATTRFVKWAAGQATQEVYFTLMLSGGQWLYDLPGGVTNVIKYDYAPITGGINTLFTIENYLYDRGMYALLTPGTGSSQYSLVSFHIAVDFLKTMARYTPDAYHYIYHKTTNQLEIKPTPASGNYTYLVDGGLYDSPGIILLKTMAIVGSTLPEWEYGDEMVDLYTAQWTEDFATAKAKEILGLIRRKFASFNALGNQGTALDGGDLVREGQDEQKVLLDKLVKEETYIGMPIIFG